MAIKENVLPLAQSSGSGTYIRTLSSGGESQRASFDIVKGAITADMDDAIEAEAEARESADTQLETELNSKVDKVTGKGLSTNDFTNALKTKLDGIEAGAEVNIIETVKVNGTALVPDANRAVNVPAPTVDSALSTTSENPVQNKVITGAVNDLKEEINDKPNWTVGSAEQIVSDDASQTDTTPYTFRRSGGGLIPFNFTREELSKVVGGTVAWNQLVQNGNFASATVWVAGYRASNLAMTNNEASYNATGNYAQIVGNNTYAKNNHIYLSLADVKASVSGRQMAVDVISNSYIYRDVSTSYTRIYSIKKATSDDNAPMHIVAKNSESGETYYAKNAMAFDLTAMFGSTIADYIYSLETATAGSGIAKLREWGFFRDSYYAYDAGSLQSVCVVAHEMRDADDNVIGNYALDSTKTLRGRFYLDSNNQLRADGDIYLPSGEVTRNWAERAYQSGDESLTDAITDGTTTVYKLTTPTTETADPYTAVQICDSDGTEEFVDALVEAGTRDVAIPVGTETVYYEDMAGKLAELPPIPSAPSANGTYTLQAVVSSGAVTYQWTS